MARYRGRPRLPPPFTLVAKRTIEAPGGKLAARLRTTGLGGWASGQRLTSDQNFRATYRADAPADPVTGKARNDDVERYVFHRGGTTAVLTLSGPHGADNVDPWRIVTDSFHWAA